MTYNVVAYIVYISLMIFIIVYMGRHFYNNGRIFILSLLNSNALLTDYINRLLLIAYYLFNIGYAFIKLNHWQTVTGIEVLFSSLSVNMGVLILILALTHYLNMGAIFFLSKSNSLIHKSFQS